jgi:hypothetical protein
MARRCTRRSLPNYFDMTSYHWNVGQNTVTWHWWMNRQHTMYVIRLSNISIKANFKQITRIELKFVQYSQGDYILCMTSHYFFCSFTNVRLLCSTWYKVLYHHTMYVMGIYMNKFLILKDKLKTPILSVKIKFY